MSSVQSSLQASGHAPINGIQMYYEIHGEVQGESHGEARDSGNGVPLVLLHGGGSTIDVTFGRMLGDFARRRSVVALEERGHGRSSDTDAPFSFESSADDVAALLR